VNWQLTFEVGSWQSVQPGSYQVENWLKTAVRVRGWRKMITTPNTCEPRSRGRSGVESYYHAMLLRTLVYVRQQSVKCSHEFYKYAVNPVINPKLNLGCLHPVACVRSGDGSFYPSTQRHYRRLIYFGSVVSWVTLAINIFSTWWWSYDRNM
jgi:hypothetical protein